MGGSGSSSKRKSSKKKREKKKKSKRKDLKKRSRVYDSDSSYSDDDSLNSGNTSSSSSESDHGIRITKKKKLRRDYSVSSYSDDQSMSSDSDSLSTYDSSYKRRKARRSRLRLKSTKKKARKRFASPNRDTDVRKRKRSSRDRVVKPRKKSSKKKSRKHLSSSSSSDSESYQSRSSSSTADGKRKRSKVILDKDIERSRSGESYKARKKRKVRSPSCSSYGRGNDPQGSGSVSHSDRAFSPVNNNSRLRSVIVVADQPDDERGSRSEDTHKEEIVYDQDDYPSPKSVDSDEGGSKMELDNHSHDAPNKRISIENATDHRSDEAHMNSFEKDKEIDVSIPVAALRGDDLESILRQKALENLRKFRGGRQTDPRHSNQEMNSESDVNGLSAERADDVHQNKSTNRGSSSAQELNQKSGTSLKQDFPRPMMVQKLPHSEHVKTRTHPLDGAALLGCSEEEKCTDSHAVLTKPVSRSETSQGTGAANVCSSSIAEPPSTVGPMSGDHSLELNEAKDGSEFEQKTMMVMRGGEMVQVSYKVYIPKKTPGLARRQLKR